MAKAIPTRTVGPLHLEDLEPHRFEDLVRQLAYDFRPWRQLEATGRSGGDDGFDARGYEGSPEPFTRGEADAEDDEVEVASEQRIWLIQCKREKAIAPKKLSGYLHAIPEAEAKGLYGIIFAAACDFSKNARDLFRTRTRGMGVAEAHLWGKAEIEDMLFQPKNDHLLFAYCGISLQTRKRSLRTDVRAKLSTKRKAKKIFEMWAESVLIRDAGDERYPYLDPNDKLDRFDRGRWRIWLYEEIRHDGMYFIFRRCPAFLDDDGVSWDFAEKASSAVAHTDPWATKKEREKLEGQRQGLDEAMPIWQELPEKNRAWYEIFLVLPFENVLALDEDGDDVFDGKHIYTVPFARDHGPFRRDLPHQLSTVERYNKRFGTPDEAKRVKIFPRTGETAAPRAGPPEGDGRIPIPD